MNPQVYRTFGQRGQRYITALQSSLPCINHGNLAHLPRLIRRRPLYRPLHTPPPSPPPPFALLLLLSFQPIKTSTDKLGCTHTDKYRSNILQMTASQQEAHSTGHKDEL